MEDEALFKKERKLNIVYFAGMLTIVLFRFDILGMVFENALYEEQNKKK